MTIEILKTLYFKLNEAISLSLKNKNCNKNMVNLQFILLYSYSYYNIFLYAAKSSIYNTRFDSQLLIYSVQTFTVVFYKMVGT